MIVDRLGMRSRYAAMHPLFPRALAFLTEFDPTLPDGRIPLDDERLFATVSSYDTSPATGRPFEAHRRYIDIQCLLQGRERILHAPVDQLEPLDEYVEEADVALCADPPASSSVLMRPGDFCILFPGDAHKSACMAGGRDAVRKILVKVAVEGGRGG